MKKNEVYKVPNGWSVKKLVDISEFITKGATPTTYGFEWVEKGVLFLKSDCVSDNGFLLGNTMQITKEAHEFMNRSKVVKGDIIMSITGNIGRVGIIPDSIDEANINQHIARIRVIDKIAVNKYIYYQLSRVETKRNYEKIKTGLAYPQISLEQVRNTQIILPKLKEQEKIVEILSTWDLAIEKQEQLIGKKKEFKKGLMQRLLTGEIRFKEFKDEWETVNLGNVFERVIQKNNTRCSNVLTISAQNGLVNQEEYFNKSVSSKDLSGYYLLNKGDFAYNKSYSNGYPLGAIKRLNNYEEGIVSPLYICFRAKGKVNTCFYEQYFESGALNREIVKIAQEGARNHGLLNISVNEFFKDIKIVKPSIEEQEKVAEVLILADKEIELLQKELEALKLQKKGLMQRLLTGEVRVKV